MTKKILIMILFTSVIIFSRCKKDFLDDKPSSDILAPSTLSELRSLLEAADRVGLTGALGQIASDEYLIIGDQNFNALNSVIQRNGYIWQKDLYEGEKVDDWNIPYQAIFYANSVLDILSKSDYSDRAEAARVKGWALFIRAAAYSDLSRNFCKVYNPATADKDLGLPLRTSPGVDEIKQRSNLSQTYQFILTDLTEASRLLDPAVPALNKNRPSKAAAWALKSRIYLNMGSYELAERSADSSLYYHDKLIDFNIVSTTSETPFSQNADEVIYQSAQIGSFSTTTGIGNRPDIEVNPALYLSYAADDLRKTIFFRTNTIGKINVKRGYLSQGVYQFTGLACDEIYLIKAECLARSGKISASMDFLNKLLIKRFKKTATYKPITAANIQEALHAVLTERWKELIWRGLRWSDLKRLNRDGANITLNRSINGKSYSLTPNDPRYVFPIPDQEILQSGIEQN